MCSNTSQNTELVGRAGIEPTTNGLKVLKYRFYGVFYCLKLHFNLLFYIYFYFNVI